MNRGPHLQELAVGHAIPDENFGPITTEMLTRWTAAADDYNPIHYDQPFALAQGLPDVIMHGPFKLSIMIRIFEEFTGKTGCVQKINCRYTAMDVPGDTLTFRGKITNKYTRESSTVLECEWAAVNQKAVTTITGSALLKVDPE